MPWKKPPPHKKHLFRLKLNIIKKEIGIKNTSCIVQSNEAKFLIDYIVHKLNVPEPTKFVLDSLTEVRQIIKNYDNNSKAMYEAKQLKSNIPKNKTRPYSCNQPKLTITDPRA